MKVLILSSLDDPHAKSVSEILAKAGADVDFLRLEDVIQNCDLSFRLGTNNNVCLLEREGGSIDFNSYLSIWNRRPGNVRAPQFVEPWIGKMVESEARSTMEGIFRSVNTIWMNHPDHHLACSNKLWQLQQATKVGFQIPETLVTNKKELVVQFFDTCNGEVIYKLIGEQTGFAIPGNEHPRGISTLPLRKVDLPYLDQVTFSPHLFQRCIQKAYDLRVTVVGHEIFCTRIDSQSGTGKIDWRHDYTVAMEPFELPTEISNRCFQFMRILGLNYGAIDLILTREDQYIFLEINSGGQYLWIEGRTKQAISSAVARLLSGALEPLVKPEFN